MNLLWVYRCKINKLVSQEGRNITRNSMENDTGHKYKDSQTRAYSIASRMTKIDFPKLDSKIFDHDYIMVRLAAIHLEGKALLWHQNFMKKCNNLLPTRAKYTEKVTLRFGELYNDPMAELKVLKQVGVVQEYHDLFDALASMLQLSKEYMLSCYFGGLDDET